MLAIPTRSLHESGQHDTNTQEFQSLYRHRNVPDCKVPPASMKRSCILIMLALVSRYVTLFNVIMLDLPDSGGCTCRCMDKTLSAC